MAKALIFIPTSCASAGGRRAVGETAASGQALKVSEAEIALKNIAHAPGHGGKAGAVGSVAQQDRRDER